MSTPRLAYDDLPTPAEMGADCLAVQAMQAALTRPLTAAARDLTREQAKSSIEVPEAAARLARAIYGE